MCVGRGGDENWASRHSLQKGLQKRRGLPMASLLTLGACRGAGSGQPDPRDVRITVDHSIPPSGRFLPAGLYCLASSCIPASLSPRSLPSSLLLSFPETVVRHLKPLRDPSPQGQLSASLEACAEKSFRPGPNFIISFDLCDIHQGSLDKLDKSGTLLVG